MYDALRSGPVHGTCVELSGRGVLLIGTPGSGKSSIALNLLAHGARLVGDDLVRLHVDGQRVLAEPAAPLFALEARRIGILSAPPADSAELMLVVDMDRTATARLPDPSFISVGGAELPLLPGREVANLAPAILVMLRTGRTPGFVG